MQLRPVDRRFVVFHQMFTKTRSKVGSKVGSEVFSEVFSILGIAILAMTLSGCQPATQTAERTDPSPPGDSSVSNLQDETGVANAGDDSPDRSTTKAGGTTDSGDAFKKPDAPDQSGKNFPSLAEILLSDEDRELLAGNGTQRPVEFVPDNIVTVDPDKAKAAGIRKLAGRHLTIYTDLPSSLAVDELPLVFDRSVPELCDYFELDKEKVADWKMTAYVIKDPELFQAANMYPANLPPFLHGYQQGREIWVREQPSDYYRRHLLLHEGVHAFMEQFAGGQGPPWYREGMAEFLATHDWKANQLKLGIIPKSAKSVPYWGRIKIIKDEVRAGRALMIRQIMRYDNQAFLEVEPYAWSWAAVAFLHEHPMFRQKFRDLKSKPKANSAFFTRDFEMSVESQLRELDEQWQLFALDNEYGYDFRRNAVSYGPGEILPRKGRQVTISAGRGWQSSGIKMIGGKMYQITASGRFQLQSKPELWWCEPGGITLQYYDQKPVGLLVGNVRRDQPRPGIANLGIPIAIGQNRRILVEGDGTLYLKINDHPASLSDNIGTITVRVVEVARRTPPASEKQADPASTVEEVN